MIAKTKLDIMDGRTALGIEFGSTRIKAVLIGSDCCWGLRMGKYAGERNLDLFT